MRRERVRNGGTRIVWTEELDDLIVDLKMNHGLSLREIVKHDAIECSTETVRRRLRELGYDTGEIRPINTVLGISKLRRWVYLWGRGDDDAVIEEITNILERCEDREKEILRRYSDTNAGRL